MNARSTGPSMVTSISTIGIRRSSSSQPQLPPRQNTGTPLTLIRSGTGALSTLLTSVHADPSSETCTVKVAA